MQGKGWVNCTCVQYGAKIQTEHKDNSPSLYTARVKHIQNVVGTFSWYARASEPTMAHTLSSIASHQSKGTEKLEEEVSHFLDYCATHPNSVVRFMNSDIILAIHSDTSYLYEPESKSRAAGHFYMSKNKDEIFNNGAVMKLSNIIKHTIDSASEAETAALFYNCKAAIPLRLTLEEMRHPQPKTPVTSENTAALGLIKKIMIPKSAKSYDIRFNFLKYRQVQNQILT